MQTIYEVSIKYCIPDTEKEGMLIRKNGIMLVEALCFGDAEKAAMAVAGSYSREPVTISAIRVSAATEVVESDQEKYYMVQYKEDYADENGNPKQRSAKVIVCAASIDDAKERFDRRYDHCTLEFEVTSIKEMKVTEHINNQFGTAGEKTERHGNEKDDRGQDEERSWTEVHEEGSERDPECNDQRGGRKPEGRRKREG